jgi:hypothetical protein
MNLSFFLYDVVKAPVPVNDKDAVIISSTPTDVSNEVRTASPV